MALFSLGDSDRKRRKNNEDRKKYEGLDQQIKGYAHFREKKEAQSSDQEDQSTNWLVTYSDAMTLLMAFFVLMLAASEIDQSKFERITSGIQGELLKKEQKKPFSETQEELQEIINQQQLQEEVQVEANPLGIKLELSSSALYEVGSAQIQQERRQILSDVAKSIKNLGYADYIVEIEGHTDDVPIKSGRYESNWELSAHRATNVVRFMMEQGIPKNHLKAAAFADSRPKVPNINEENRAKNRRVVIYIRRKMAGDSG